MRGRADLLITVRFGQAGRLGPTSFSFSARKVCIKDRHGTLPLRGFVKPLLAQDETL